SRYNRLSGTSASRPAIVLAAWIRAITATAAPLETPRNDQCRSSSSASLSVSRSRACRAGLALGGGSCLRAPPISSISADRAAALHVERGGEAGRQERWHRTVLGRMSQRLVDPRLLDQTAEPLVQRGQSVLRGLGDIGRAGRDDRGRRVLLQPLQFGDLAGPDA